MLLEKGGRADKAGNRYEIKCIIYELLRVIDEKSYSVTIEGIGDDEKGADIIVVKEDGVKEYIQCKASNGVKDSWRVADLRDRELLKKWSFQLKRNFLTNVSLMSPISSPIMESLIDRAKNTGIRPQDFYQYQICGNKEIEKGYKTLCSEMKFMIDPNSENYVQEIAKSIDCLKRISINSISSYALDEYINNKIQFLFLTEVNIVRNALVAFIIDSDILGNEVTLVRLKKYFKEQGLFLRSLEVDGKEHQRLIEINREYKSGFRPINGTLLFRSEFDKCTDMIKQDKSFVISGHAGTGKSGCTEAIINYCESQNLPYIAIKLDRKTPHDSCDAWSKSLGFPYSFAYILHKLSINENAIIILDQLDALRWTQSNSMQALDVCMELIRQVNAINRERIKKICVVFVCRKYDIENDNNIRSLFELHDNNQFKTEWEKINIGEFDDDIVKGIVGKYYDTMSNKLRKLIHIPSNLYIWEKIKNKNIISDCATAGQLIEEWYKQICHSCINNNISEKIINELDILVNKLEETARLYIPKSAITLDLSVYDYLVSSGIIIEDDKKIGFVHQSILDYFISKKMVKQYVDRCTIEKIIGSKSNQTPSRRYQVQMFLQNILDYDVNDFLVLCDAILDSQEIRYYIKFLVYECIGQIESPDEAVYDYVLSKLKNWDNITYWLNNVIYGKNQYVSFLLEKGVLERWFGDSEKRNIVFNLLNSVSKDLSVEEIKFIEYRSFLNKEDDKKFASVIWQEFSMDSNELFEYRMKLYSHYPELLQNVYIQLNKLLPQNEERAVRIIALWYENRDKLAEIHINGISDIVEESDNYVINDGEYVLDQLLKYVPQDNSYNVKYSDWSERYFQNRSTERLIIGLIKKANVAIIKNRPSLFWKYYDSYMGKGFYLYDELILHGLRFFPNQYSDKIILYICLDFNKNIYDKMSSIDDQLGYVKEVIRVHTKWCSDETFKQFEVKLMNYIPAYAIIRYKDRIDRNRTKEYPRVYWSYWGELQYELLKEVPYERLSKESKNLLDVLNRKFVTYNSPYLKGNGHSGWVNSPIKGKQIGKKEWLQIITNKKINSWQHGKTKEVKGGFIESSLSMYVSDFSSAVSQNPEEMINVVLSHKKDINVAYIDVLFSGAAFSEKINEVKQDTWEWLFHEFPCDMEGQRAFYFCEIIEKRSEFNWSSEIYEQLKDIADNHQDTLMDENKQKEYDSRSLFEHSLNCAKGHAARSIEKLLWDHETLINVFRTFVDKLTQDNADFVRMASLFPLWPIYNIDREWAKQRIIKIYETDFRCVKFPDSKDMLLRLYQDYRERVTNIVKACFESNDKEVVQIVLESGGISHSETSRNSQSWLKRKSQCISLSFL